MLVLEDYPGLMVQLDLKVKLATEVLLGHKGVKDRRANPGDLDLWGHKECEE